MKPKIFLCHANEDKARVQAIYLQLRSAGLNPWMDKPPAPYDLDGINAGEDWDSRIRKEIRECAYFAALLSPNAVSKRGYVQREFRLALRMAAEMPTGQVFLIPALLEPCDPPEIEVDTLSVAKLQWIELEHGDASLLIRVLERDIGNRSAPLSGSGLRLQVNTVEELLLALGSDRIIQLAPGTYDLSKLEPRFLRHVEFGEVFDGQQIVVQDVRNLVIRGAPENGSRIVTSPQYGYVLRFVRCCDFRISDVVLGHEPEGFCSGGVLSFSGCRDVMVSGCDLFGSGTEGLTLYDVEDFVFNNSVIRDCTSGIMGIRKSRGLRFEESLFTRNQMYHGIAVSHSDDIAFTKCNFEGNRLVQPLFSVFSSLPIRLTEVRIVGNEASRLANRQKDIIVENITCTENNWHESEEGVEPVFWEDERGENDIQSGDILTQPLKLGDRDI